MNTELITILAGQDCEKNNSQLLRAEPWRDGIITVERTSDPVLYPYSVAYRLASRYDQTKEVMEKTSSQVAAETIMDAYISGTIAKD